MRASASKPGRKGPITECDTLGPFPFPEKPDMILFPVFYTHFYIHTQNTNKFILYEEYRSQIYPLIVQSADLVAYYLFLASRYTDQDIYS